MPHDRHERTVIFYDPDTVLYFENSVKLQIKKKCKVQMIQKMNKILFFNNKDAVILFQ